MNGSTLLSRRAAAALAVSLLLFLPGLAAAQLGGGGLGGPSGGGLGGGVGGGGGFGGLKGPPCPEEFDGLPYGTVIRIPTYGRW